MDEELFRVTGKNAVKLYRMPYGLGEYSQLPNGIDNVLKWGAEAGYIHVGWTVDTLDWVNLVNKGTANAPYFSNARNLARILSRVDNKGNGGTIVLSHLIRYRSSKEEGPAELLDPLIQQLKIRTVPLGKLSDYIRQDPVQ